MAGPGLLAFWQDDTAVLEILQTARRPDSTVIASVCENTAVADMAALGEMDPLAPGLEGTAIASLVPPAP